MDPTQAAAFGACQVVELGELQSMGGARTAGVRAARAPLVVLCEQHCYPAPGWAEALVASHRQPGVAAVAPVFYNANPRFRLSWADFLVLYGPFMAPVPAGDYPDLPGHNTCYQREALEAYGDQLERWLEMESILHYDLRAKGCRLILEPKARVYHLNMTRLSSALRENFITGRFFASARARVWPGWRRLAYGAAWPLIALVRFRRIFNDWRRVRASLQLGPDVLPAVGFLLCVAALGELAGYLTGAGGLRRELLHLELVREDHLAPGDRVIEPA
jgi:hypothetical protein